MDSSSRTLETLRTEALAAAARAYVPYSHRGEATVLLLSDGTWIPGVRVESASFSLTIPAVTNAFSTAVAAGRRDVVAVVLSRPAHAEDEAFLQAAPTNPFAQREDDVFVADGVQVLPRAAQRLSPFLNAPLPETPAGGIVLARTVARQALVPESDFPVGCILITEEGRLVPGVNVEHPDWSRILCAERNALGTAITWGLKNVTALYLTCLKDRGATPCGACRQLLVELAPASELWMDRGDAPPEASSPELLLPGAFSGRALRTER